MIMTTGIYMKWLGSYQPSIKHWTHVHYLYIEGVIHSKLYGEPVYIFPAWQSLKTFALSSHLKKQKQGKIQMKKRCGNLAVICTGIFFFILVCFY